MKPLKMTQGENYIIKKSIQSAAIFKNKQPLLKHLDIELTERCNNACVHCYINLPRNDSNACKRELTTAQWKDIIKQAADLGALSIRFTGGEPLLREDFSEIYLFTRRLGLKVILFTNARLITADIVDLFTEVPPMRPIEISVYGMHSDSYDAVSRVPGSFDEFWNGVNLLLDGEIPIAVKSVLLPDNMTDKGEFETWAATIPGMEKPFYSIYLDLRTRRDSLKKNSLIRNLRFTPEEVISFLSQDIDTYFHEMAQFMNKFLYPQGNHLFNCGAGNMSCIDAYGNYQMCMLLRHPDVTYNMTNSSLHEALTDFVPHIRELEAINPEYLQRCANCFLKGLCLQCPGKSWSEHGTLDTPVEYLCQVAHAQAFFLGLLQQGEKAWEVVDWKNRINKFISTTLSADSGLSSRKT